jgi:hypothetical protein
MPLNEGYTSMAVKKDTKAKFDEIKLNISAQKKKKLSDTDTIQELIERAEKYEKMTINLRRKGI